VICEKPWHAPCEVDTLCGAGLIATISCAYRYSSSLDGATFSALAIFSRTTTVGLVTPRTLDPADVGPQPASNPGQGFLRNEQ
jgi:hypothetical protein